MVAILEEKKLPQRVKEASPETSEASALADDLISRMFPVAREDTSLSSNQMPGLGILAPLMTCHGDTCHGPTCQK